MDAAVIVILLSIGLVVGVIYATKHFVVKDQQRECLSCGYKGTMKTWVGNHSAPQLIVLILLLFYIVPGLLFIAWAWGKRKCPRCGVVGKNVDASPGGPDLTKKKCPFCAEEVMREAVVCRYCGRDIPGAAA